LAGVEASLDFRLQRQHLASLGNGLFRAPLREAVTGISLSAINPLHLEGNGESRVGTRNHTDCFIATTLRNESQHETTDYNSGEAVQQFANGIQQKTTVRTRPTGISTPKSW
jgi:hypothetical protein